MNKHIREISGIFSQEDVSVYEIHYGKHLKFLTSIGPIYASCSPGDRRSVWNLRALIRRKSRN